MENEEKIGFYLFISLIIIIVGLFIYHLSSATKIPENSIKLNKSWKLISSNKTTTVNPPFHEYVNKQKNTGIKTLKTNFNYSNEFNNPYIVIPILDNNSYKLYINDKEVGEVGDLQTGRSNIWNYTEIFSIKKYLKNGQNEIQIKMNVLYSYGIFLHPFINDKSSAYTSFYKLNLINNLYPKIASGILIILGVILISINIFLKNKKNNSFLFIGLYFFILPFYFIDYTYLKFLPFQYYIFKKIVVTSSLTSMMLLYIGYFKYLKNKLNKLMKICISVFILLILYNIFIVDNLIYLRKFYSYAFLILIFMMGHILLSTFKQIKNIKDYKNIMLFISVLLASLFFLHDILIIFTGGTEPQYSHFGVSIIFIFFSITIIYDFLILHRNILLEKTKANFYYKESFQDDLTGAKNRKFLNIIKNKISNFSIIILDIDDFKQINDKYGHNVGDKVLKKLTKLFIKNTRENDFIIRYGGDEFLIILNTCNKNNAVKITEKLYKKIHSLQIKTKNVNIKITCSFGIASSQNKKETSLRNLIKIADKNLYKAKEKGKDTYF